MNPRLAAAAALLLLAAAPLLAGARVLQDAAAAAAPAERKVLASGGSSFSGDGTAYSDTVRDGAAFACSYRALPAFAQSHFAAVPPARWENGAACGRCVSVKCVDERCAVRGEARVGMVVDKCPECADGDIDMSVPLNEEVTGIWPHRLAVEWEFVECGDRVDESVKMAVKDGSNAQWKAFYLSPTAKPLASVVIRDGAGNAVEGARQEFNFWTFSGLGDGPYEVTLTAEGGEAKTARVADLSEAVDLGVQMGDAAAP